LPSELGERDLAQWRRMHDDLSEVRHPFLTAEFARAIGESAKHARVADVEDAGERVGFLRTTPAMSLSPPT
jgi:CelD/BcsL family acetyltransferase involved in cellulose biosynthesis